MANTVKILLTCPRCGDSNFIKRKDEDGIIFECAACGEKSYPEDMSSKVSDRWSNLSDGSLEEDNEDGKTYSFCVSNPDDFNIAVEEDDGAVIEITKKIVDGKPTYKVIAVIVDADNVYDTEFPICDLDGDDIASIESLIDDIENKKS